MDVPDATMQLGSRIKREGVVAQDSDPLHGSSIATVQAGDFTRPVDGPPVMGNEVKCYGLALTQSIGTWSSHLTFSSPFNSKLATLDVPLTYDVHFIASYPCHPSLPLRFPLPPSSTASPVQGESLDSKDKSTTEPTDSAHASPTHSGLIFSKIHIGKSLPPSPAHPLHIDYHYDTVPVATLLNMPPETGRARALSLPADRVKTLAADTPAGLDDEVVVLDCRGTPDLELLARAWCAKVGENAMIGKSGRTCLACCVREARALGVSVVIRI